MFISFVTPALLQKAARWSNYYASEQPVGSLYSSSMCGAPPPAPPYTFATARHVDPKGFLSCKTLIDDGGRRTAGQVVIAVNH